MAPNMKRFAGLMLTASFLCPMLFVSGCAKPKRDVPEVTEDMPWYEASINSVDPGLNVSDYTYCGMLVAGKAGDYVVFRSFAQKAFGLYDVFTPEYNDYRLVVHDLDGNYCYDVDTKELIRSVEAEATQIFIDDITVVSDEVVISASFVAGDEYKEQAFTYDPGTQEITSTRDIRTAEEMAADPNSDYAFTNYTAQVEEYYVKNYDIALENGLEHHFAVTTPDGETKDICINDEFPMDYLVLSYDFLYLGDSVFAVKYETYEHSNIFCIIDIDNGTVKEAGDTEYSWLYDVTNNWDYKYYNGIGNALLSQDGITLLDVETHEETVYIDFDDCDINRFDAASLEIIDLQDGKVTLAGVILRNETSQMVFNYDAEIVVLQRCDTNPHVGEKILTAASFDELTYPMAEAIRLFNLNNEDAIIIMDPKYSYDVVSKDIIFDANMDDETYDLQVKAAFMNLLSIDLLANEGPDIILGTMEYDQLNDPAMMLDLSDCTEVEGVYENIMGFAKTEDKIYQVPVAVQLEGIMVDKDSTDTSVPGFSYDSFQEYLYGPCNGSDPCLMTRVEYLLTILAEEGYTFRTEDGGYDLNNERFAEAAAFVDSLNLMSDEELADQLASQSWMSNDFSDHAVITTGLELLYQTGNLVSDKILMGFPSSEAKGALMNVEQSVGVCAATGAPEACKAFVKYLLQEDIQTVFGKYCGISVNCNAQAEACRFFADMMNGYFECIEDVHPYQDRLALQEPVEAVDPETFVSVMDGYIRNAAGFRHSEAAVELIIREEIQAYFAGQKTIEEVMDIIQNRVDLYVEERG